MPPVIETGAGNRPNIGSVSGLGTGGAGFFSSRPANEASFSVGVLAGPGVATSGGFTLSFASPPAQTIVAFSDTALGTVTLTPSGSNIAVAWTGATMIPGQRYSINFQWPILD